MDEENIVFVKGLTMDDIFVGFCWRDVTDENPLDFYLATCGKWKFAGFVARSIIYEKNLNFYWNVCSEWNCCGFL